MIYQYLSYDEFLTVENNDATYDNRMFRKSLAILLRTLVATSLLLVIYVSTQTNSIIRAQSIPPSPSIIPSISIIPSVSTPSSSSSSTSTSQTSSSSSSSSAPDSSKSKSSTPTPVSSSSSQSSSSATSNSSVTISESRSQKSVLDPIFIPSLEQSTSSTSASFSMQTVDPLTVITPLRTSIVAGGVYKITTSNPIQTRNNYLLAFAGVFCGVFFLALNSFLQHKYLQSHTIH